MTQTDKSIGLRILRRLRSSRGSAFAEFAFTMPLVIMLMCFAVDFMRILYCEQQVEIATRALCDVESHIRAGSDKCPASIGKVVVRNYLAEALQKEGLAGASYVYCKGEVIQQAGLIHTAVNKIVGFIDDLAGKDAWYWKILGKLVKFAVKLITMGTQAYVTEIIPNDKIVKTSVSVKTQTYVPSGVYDFFGTKVGASECNWVNIPAYAPGFKEKSGERTRYYCYLPVMDTAAVAPQTYIRQLTKVLNKWVKLDE